MADGELPGAGYPAPLPGAPQTPGPAARLTGPERGPTEEGTAETAQKAQLARAPRSPLLTHLAMRAALIPIQLLFVLLLLFIAIELPLTFRLHPHMTVLDFFQYFYQMVTNIVTGNWGPGPYPYQASYFQLWLDFLPGSIELALFALPIALAIAYPLSLVLGWTRRPAADVPTRVITLAAALLPLFIVAWLVINALFFAFFNAFHDLDSIGFIPTPTWMIQTYGGVPNWIIYGAVTRPTGFPLVDGAIHQAWSFDAITLTKTLIQASVVALAYVAIFLRHARSVVLEASQEPHMVAARARGVPEQTLLWRHAARRVLPTLLIVLALTIPGYLVAQFVVEAAFNDPGVGWLTISALAAGDPNALQGLIFLMAAFVLVAVLVVDVVANWLDPRGSTRR